MQVEDQMEILAPGPDYTISSGCEHWGVNEQVDPFPHLLFSVTLNFE